MPRSPQEPVPSKYVRGVGPKPCDICFVGEGPGFHEGQRGIPFIGATGRELDRFLDGFNLPRRSEIFLTNLYRYFKGKDYEWTQEDLARDTPDLERELAAVQPDLIVALGRHAARYFLGDVDIDDTHGLAYYDPHVSGREIFVVTHPAAGLHSSDAQAIVAYDFGQLAAFLRGDIESRTLFEDEYEGQEHYLDVHSVRQLDAIFNDVTHGAEVALDTEGYPARPWSIQFSLRAGRAYLVRASRPEVVAALGRYLVKRGCRITYQNCLHDFSINRALGLEDINVLPFDDTMVMAYLLQVEPQGLKPLCVRHCNMKMQSYQDVLGDASIRLALAYLGSVYDCEQFAYEQQQQAAFAQANRTPLRDAKGKIRKTKDGRTRYRRTTVLPKLPKTLLHKAVERCYRSKDPRALWENQVEDVQVAGYRALGPIWDATLDHVPEATARHYACRDADGTARLKPLLAKRLDALKLREVYELELGTYPLIDRMMFIGVKPDLPHFERLSATLQTELHTLHARLATATGTSDFNANSGDQVAYYLFDCLGLDGGKKTSQGRFSTNDKILEGLEHAHPELPVISTIREYREVYKLKHTFCDRIPDFVNRWPHDGRIHTTLRTTRVVTGRLAASDPNLLAQPEHGKFAKDFKRGWIPELGHVLYQADESQIELRGLAHLSQDAVLLDAFRTGKDLHAALAERIFGVKPAQQDKSKHRLPAKAINFGIPMGMTSKGLAVELRKNGLLVSEDDAQRWLDETLNLYQGVARFMDARKAEVRRKGFVRCLSGRIRYIGGIHSTIPAIREESERFAFSTPIQESAQFIVKQAEIQIWKDIIKPLQADGHWIEPLLQVHDCIRLELEEGLVDTVHEMMQEAMTNVPMGFSVPLAIEGEYGPNLADMVKL